MTHDGERTAAAGVGGIDRKVRGTLESRRDDRDPQTRWSDVKTTTHPGFPSDEHTSLSLH
jgi:UDP-N-acetylglucosamine enolpyruvyl transferase